MFGFGQGRLVRELTGRVNELEGALIDALSGVAIGSSGVTGNDYTDRSTAVKTLKAKYMNEESWGCPFIQRIVNIRRAMVMPYGVRTSPIDGMDAEDSSYQAAKNVVDRFLDVNDFNEGFGIDLAKEGELEGNVLVDLSRWDTKNHTVRLIYRPLSDYEYTVYRETDDPGKIKDVRWKEGNTFETASLPEKDLSFVYFNGLLNGFAGVPTSATVLSTCENLHKSLMHWHRFNSYFAKVTPIFECATEEEADKVREQIASSGWKLEQAFALAGKFRYESPQAASVADTLKGEITISVQVVAGHTGVGPHFLGFPNLMSNRSTSESLGEPNEVVSIAEISRWRQFYEDMFDKVIRKHNQQMGRKVQEGLVKPKLLPMSDRQWKRAMEFWLPARKDSLISRELFLKNVPDVDVGEEIRLQNNEEVDRWLGQDEQPESFGQDTSEDGSGEDL